MGVLHIVVKKGGRVDFRSVALYNRRVYSGREG